MAGRVEGKVALITGGASGIGRGCAEKLAAEGATAVVTDLQDEKGAETVALIEKAGGKAWYLHHDVTDEAAWESVVAEIKSREGRLDILVNNAGIGIGGSILDMTLADWRRQTAVNLDGVFLGVKHFPAADARVRRGRQHHQHVLGGGAEGLGHAGRLLRHQGGVRLFTKSIAMECANAKDGIRVNSVHPGLIETPIWLTVGQAVNPLANAPPDLDAMSALAVPLGVKGWPEDIANGVLWLASDESRYVTGQELVIDGGMTVR